MEPNIELAKALPSGSVVVGVDGSEAAARALDWAIADARRSGRPLGLVHAAELVGGVWLGQAGIDPRAVLESMRTEGDRMLERARTVAQEAAPDVEVHSMQVSADPRSALLALSERAHSIVLGSRGRGPVKSLVLGSVSVAVSRHADCPVVVLRPGAAPGGRGVLVAVDGTSGSLPAVSYAYGQASTRGVPLTVMHSFWDLPTAAVGATQIRPGDQGYQDLEMLMAESVSGLAEMHPDVAVQATLWRGLPEDCIVEASRGLELTVVGHRHRNAVAAVIFGSVAAGVLEHASGAVAVVPAAD